MKKNCFILSFTAIVALTACSTQELESPANLQNGMLMVRPIMPEVEIETKADLPTIYAFIPEELNAGTVNPVLPKINSGNTYYYNLEGVGSDVVFSNQDLSYAVSPRYDENGFSLVKTDQYSADLGTELLFGVATGIQTGNTEPYEVRLNRFSSSVQFKFMAYDTDGNELPAETFQYADATLGGFATELRFGSDITTSAPAPYGNTSIAESAALQDGQWLSTPRNVIPGTEQMDYDVNITLSDGTSGNFKGSLGRTLEANHSYIITFRMKKANGSASFTLEEPEVYEDNFFNRTTENEMFIVNNYHVLQKDAGNSVLIPVELIMPYEWGYTLIEGSEYFNVEQTQDGLVVTTLSENIDDNRNGLIRLHTSAGHTKDLYITQINSAKQVISFTPDDRNIYVYAYIYGENIEVDTGSGFMPVQSGEQLPIWKPGQVTTTIQADCIYSYESRGYEGTYSFTNCVSLTDLNIEESGTGHFDASVLPALRRLILDGSGISGITFSTGQKIETLSCRSCENLETLNLTDICEYLNELYCENCPLLKSLEIYPTDYSGEKQINTIDFSRCTAMTGVGLPNYTNLKSINLDDCTAMESINLSGCTSLNNLSINSNNASFINISECSGLQTLTLSRMTIDRMLNSGCNALEKVTVSSVTMSNFDFSNMASLKKIEFNSLKCDQFNVSGCTALSDLECRFTENISSNNVDVSNCTNLTNLPISFSTSAAQSVNMEGCISLHTIVMGYLRIDLDFNSLPALKSLTLNNASISALDLSECSNFEELTYTEYYNATKGITSLSLPKSIKHITLRDNNVLTAGIDLSGYPALETIHIDEFQSIPEIDLSGCQSLTSCNITDNNNLKSLNLNDCSALININKSGLSSNTSLETVNIDNCSSLQEMYLTNGKIVSLDFSTCPRINTIDCRNNMLETDALNSLFTSIPDRNSDVVTGKLYISGNPGAETCDESIIFSKNWYFPNN